MNIIINHDYRSDMTQDLPLEALARMVLEHEEMPANTEVSVTFVDNEEIARLNEEYRGKEGPTDVLSFECDGLFDEMEDSEGFGAEIFELGDIVIAVDVVDRQAGGYGNTFEQEVQLMLVHGLLHLCGYDHIEDDEAEEMESLQADLLAAWSARA